ncbi:MAG: UDP-3-O-acyl-N-acetylglucosamine deacetylase [Candidatus Melainabacteria bacterium]
MTVIFMDELSHSVEQDTLVLTGTGLVTGKPVRVEIEPAPAGHGVVFYLDGDLPIPARLESVVNTMRGVTLGHLVNGEPSGKFVTLVEHFLAAAMLAGQSDLAVSVYGEATELPILDGSAAEWYQALVTRFGKLPVAATVDLPQAVFYRHSDDTLLYALPAEHFQVTYAVDFDHPDLTHRWVRWDALHDGPQSLVAAGTFGHVKELPVLQAMGLARGVTQENTLGLTDEGGYTRELRMDDEPIYHKIIDLIGDLSLMGLNPLSLKAHIFAIKAGHGSHTKFAARLLRGIPVRPEK